jgi:hypothetical protein
MKRLRSLARQSPAITIAITALVFSLAGAAGATVAQPTTTWHWHRLSLLHNWHSSAAVYGTGSPSFAVTNGVVYLSGSLHHAPNGHSEFAVLPSWARPKHALYISVYANSEAIGTLYIGGGNGQMEAYSPDGSSAQLFTSLAGVSFALGS